MLNTFGGLPDEYTSFGNAKIALLPVPYDMTSTYGKGADRGPAALIDATPYLEFYDFETDYEVYRKGIFIAKPISENTSPEKVVDAVYREVAGFLKAGKFTVVLGGEHTVSIGTVKAHSEKFRNVSVLQLDAHSDLRQEYLGSKYNHACAMARIKEYCPIVQVGIRSTDVSELEYINRKNVFLAEDIFCRKEYSNYRWADKVVKRLPENVYITVDLDVFDPSVLPGTGTPEPGGLGWYDVLVLVKKTMMQKNVIGFDIVELAPDESRVSEFTAAKLLYKMLSYKFAKSR